jgi:hypothetical protein
MSLQKDFSRKAVGVVGYLEAVGLDPAFVTPGELTELELGYSRVPGERGQRSENPREEFVPADQLTNDDLDFWMACI